MLARSSLYSPEDSPIHELPIQGVTRKEVSGECQNEEDMILKRSKQYWMLGLPQDPD
jgi:hypothetical protein